MVLDSNAINFKKWTTNTDPNMVAATTDVIDKDYHIKSGIKIPCNTKIVLNGAIPLFNN